MAPAGRHRRRRRPGRRHRPARHPRPERRTGRGAERREDRPHAAASARPDGAPGPDLQPRRQATLERAGTEEQSLAIIHRAIDLGVNYIDTARRYGSGVSEGYVGQVMKTRRKEVFLASKTRDRTYDGSMRSLEESLKALQTDHLDLWQCHNVMTDADLEQMFAKDGAVRALEKAREQKLVRLLGITGHYDPAVLRRGIERSAISRPVVNLLALKVSA